MMMRIKEICDYVSRGSTPDYVDESPYKVMNQASFSKGYIDESKQRFTSKISQGANIRKGDLLMASTGGGVLGKVFYFDSDDESFYADSHVTIMRDSRGKNLMKYLYYAFSLKYDEINATLVKGSTNQTELQRNYLLAYEMEMPSTIEQKSIVDYLDEKTKAIDARISVLEKKSDAYTRLKASVINRAVTRGLNPNVTLKDSGIEWISMIPEHWEVKRFKDLFKDYTTGVTPPSKDDSFFDIENGYTWVTIADLNNKMILESNLNLTQKAVDKYTPEITKKGSLMFSFKLSIGKLAFADKDLYTNEAIVSIPPQKGICLDHAYYYLPLVLDKNATENIYGAKMLNQKIIANMLMAVPSYSEQQSIASYLDTKCAEIDKAIDNIGKQIDALKRLKRSLINEVVTGKRKV